MNIGNATLNYIVDQFARRLENIELYAGAMPATPNDTPAGELIASFSYNISSMWNNFNDFVIQDGAAVWKFDTWDSPPAFLIHANSLRAGTVGFARMETRGRADPYYKYDLTVGVIGSGAEFELDSLTVEEGETLVVRSGQIRFNLTLG